MRKSWDEYFFDIARIVATRSTCPRLSVGCVIVDPPTHRIISTGYNGSEPGSEHCDYIGCYLVDGHCKRAIHAERNAIYLPMGYHLYKSRAYVTHKPCDRCMDLLQKWEIDVKWEQNYESPKI